RGRHLVQQRLELVIVVAIDQRDPDVIVVGQLLRAAKPGESAADNHDVVSVVPGAHEATGASFDAATLAPIRSSRWSPTRSALPIAVRAGLTAPMLGKKLVSTT